MTQRGQAVPRGGSGGEWSRVALIPGSLSVYYPVDPTTQFLSPSHRITLIGTRSVSLTRLALSVGSPPSNSTLIIDVIMSTDDGASWDSISGGSGVSLVVGDKYAASDVSGVDVVDGDLLQVVILHSDVTGSTPGTAADLEVCVVGE